jgi:hypothetical protein
MSSFSSFISSVHFKIPTAKGKSKAVPSFLVSAGAKFILLP